jgi:hypothetical protein
MLYDPRHGDHLAALEARLQRADVVTSELMSDVMATGCIRLGALGRAPKAKLKWLIEAGAWTDAAMALLELELPQWKLRHLVRDDGEWFCSLSRQPELPIGYDETAEATHESLPVAILLTFVQTRRASNADAPSKTTVPQLRPISGNAICCDNFA